MPLKSYCRVVLTVAVLLPCAAAVAEESWVDKAKSGASTLWEATKEGAAEGWEATKGGAAKGWEATKEGAGKATDWSGDKLKQGWEATKDGAAWVGEKAERGVEAGKEALQRDGEADPAAPHSENGEGTQPEKAPPAQMI